MGGSNYIRMGERAREEFLKYDQESMIRLWKLEADADNIYIRYIGQDFRIDRVTGEILPVSDKTNPGERQNDFFPEDRLPGWKMMHPEDGLIDPEKLVHVRMVVYDLLTRPAPLPPISGKFCSISALGGIIGTSHENTLGYDRKADLMCDHVDEICRACERLGGIKSTGADVSYEIPLVTLPPEEGGSERRPLRFWFRFWEKDEEFPAQIRFQWDENILQFMYYETIWYVMRHVTDLLLSEAIGEVEASVL